MKRLAALLVVGAAAMTACTMGSSGSNGQSLTFSGAEGVDGSTWAGELLAVVRGTTTQSGRHEARPCLVVFGVLRATTPAALTVPLALPIRATVDGAVSNGVLGECSPDGEVIGPTDPFGQWLAAAVAPGAEVAFHAGFTEFDGVLPDSIQLTLGVDGPSAVVVDVGVTEVAPRLPLLAVGTVPNLASADTEFRYVSGADIATRRVLGYDIVADDEVGFCLRLFTQTVANVAVDQTSFLQSMPPAPQVMVNGVAAVKWPGGCSSAAGYFHFGPTIRDWATEKPWPAGVPYGVLWTYVVPADATVQAVVVEDGDNSISLELVRLDSPPPTPGG